MDNDLKIKEGHEYIVKIGEKINFDGSFPTESVTELVRCKDCKHRNGYECNHIMLGNTKCGVKDDWFCADGERKDGDNNAP